MRGNPKNPNTLENAIRRLADACDGAQSLDGVGFNRDDSELGHYLAGFDEKYWTYDEKRFAWVMLIKYKQQLKRYGVDFEKISEPGRVNKPLSLDDPRLTEAFYESDDWEEY